MEDQKETKKLSYEQLEQAAGQLSMQLQQAQKQINQMGGVLTRLPFLFEIVKLGKTHFTKEFVENCTKEIESIMTIPEEKEEPEQKE